MGRKGIIANQYGSGIALGPFARFGIDAVGSFVRFGIHAQRKCLVQLNETSSLGVGLEFYERTCWVSVLRTNVLDVSVIAIFGRQVRVVRTSVGYSSFIAARCIVEALLFIVFCNLFFFAARPETPGTPPCRIRFFQIPQNSDRLTNAPSCVAGLGSVFVRWRPKLVR